MRISCIFNFCNCLYIKFFSFLGGVVFARWRFLGCNDWEQSRMEILEPAWRSSFPLLLDALIAASVPSYTVGKQIKKQLIWLQFRPINQPTKWLEFILSFQLHSNLHAGASTVSLRPVYALADLHVGRFARWPVCLLNKWIS